MPSNITNNNNNNTNYDSIPPELRSLRQWVVWQWGERDGKPTKLPINFNGGALASTVDENTWGNYDQCASAYAARSHKYSGIGFVFTKESPYTGIDLDHCVDSAGNIELWAKRIIHNFHATYIEFSQSGHGIHIIVKGKLPELPDGQKKRCRTDKCPNVEVYESGRYFIMTGNLIPDNKGELAALPNELAELYAELFAAVEQPMAKKQKPSTKKQSNKNDVTLSISDLSDSELIHKACSAKNGAAFSQLWSGDTSANGNDHSAADQALCNLLAFWTACDASRMDSLFRQSGLYRDKWDRTDYRDLTIGRAIADCAEVYEPKGKKRTRNSDSNSSSDCEASSPGNRPTTDLGNAERLIDTYGDDIRYDVNSCRWLIWNGKYWQPDNTGEIERLARNVIRAMHDELKDQNPDQREALWKHIKRSENAGRLHAMIELARWCPGVPIQSADLDRDYWLINCLNGVLDLRTGAIRPHSQEDLITKIVPVEYDDKSECKRWMQFLDEIFQNNADLISFVKRMSGYLMTGDTREESVFILTGKGQNGKSKFVDMLHFIMGDYSKDTPIATFIERKNDNTADLASLVGARIVTASEAEDTQSFNESLLKRLSGRDPITCRHLYKEFFTYIPTFKVVFSTNEVPKIRSQNFAMKRRIKIIPFRQRFYDPEDGKQPIKDDQLESKLRAESAGVLRWMVEGCLEWQKHGLMTPPTIKTEVNKLFQEQDPLAEFLESDCVLGEGASVTVSSLWNAYLAWCKGNDRNPAFKQTNWFSRCLTQRDEIDSARSGFERFFVGIRLHSANQFFINSELDFTKDHDANDAKTDFGEKSAHVKDDLKKFCETANNASLRHETDFQPKNNNQEDKPEDSESEIF